MTLKFLICFICKRCRSLDQSLLFSPKRAITTNAILSKIAKSMTHARTHIFFPFFSRTHSPFLSLNFCLKTYQTSAPPDCFIFHDIYTAKPKGSRKNKFVIFGYLVCSLPFIVCIFLWSHRICSF